jgi:hypothetical protein
VTLPADVRNYPDAITQALSELRLVGVNGPYRVVLGADAYTAVSEARDYGYPVLQHLQRLVENEIVWARRSPAPSSSAPAAAISSCISGRISRSTIRATARPRFGSTSRRVSRSSC